jgi:hypothetical protein
VLEIVQTLPAQSHLEGITDAIYNLLPDKTPMDITMEGGIP